MSVLPIVGRVGVRSSHTESRQASLQAIVLRLGLFRLRCRGLSLGNRACRYGGLSCCVLESNFPENAIVDVLGIGSRARILHHFECIAHHFRLDAGLLHLHGERLHCLLHLGGIHVRIDRGHDLRTRLQRLEHLLVHLHARHLVLHDRHLTCHASILVALGPIPGDILGQNLRRIVLSRLG